MNLLIPVALFTFFFLTNSFMEGRDWRVVFWYFLFTEMWRAKQKRMIDLTVSRIQLMAENRCLACLFIGHSHDSLDLFLGL